MQGVSTELHKRLLHLTSFSSGMIVLGADNPGRGAALVSQFIAALDEDVNVAFVKGNPGTADAAYRQQLIRQLVGTMRLDFGLPLNELLPPLTADTEQALLIAFSGADALSDEFIDELWTWLGNEQNRCAVNVLLSGSKALTARLRQRLTGDRQPVYLFLPESESSSQQMSELEAMLAEKRQAFSARLAARGQRQAESGQPLLARPLTRLALAVVFLLTFGSLLWWLHPELRLLSEPTPQVQPVPEMQGPQSLAPVAENTESAKAATDASAMPPAQPATTKEEAPAVALVTDWSDEVKRMDEVLSESASPEPSLSTLSETTEAEAEAVRAESPEPSDEPADAPQPMPHDSAQQPDIGVVTDGTYDAQILMNLPVPGYLIQLSAASDPAVITRFVQNHGLEGTVWHYQTRRYGGPWHVLLQASAYANMALARQALDQLPDALKAQQPFLKSLAQIRREIADNAP